MKKMLLFFALMAVILFVGCHGGDNSDSLSQSNSDDQTVIRYPLPSQTVEVQGMEEWEEMKQMAKCNDEVQLEQYIQSVVNRGIQSKDDLLAFVELMESLPQIPILNSDITWMRFSRGVSEDTGKETIVVYILTEAKNGDWTRVEYVLSVMDVSKKIAEEKGTIDKNTILTSPIKTHDQKMELHIETREPHPSGQGTMIKWVGEVDGIFTRIYYYSQKAEEVKTEQLLHDIQISKGL